MLKGSGRYFYLFYLLSWCTSEEIGCNHSFSWGAERYKRLLPRIPAASYQTPLTGLWAVSVGCTVLLWRSWWGLTTAGCDPDELSYFRMENICLPESRTCSTGSSWRKRMMLEDVWRLGAGQVQDPAEQGLKESSNAPCISGPEWEHWTLSK